MKDHRGESWTLLNKRTSNELRLEFWADGHRASAAAWHRPPCITMEVASESRVMELMTDIHSVTGKTPRSKMNLKASDLQWRKSTLHIAEDSLPARGRATDL